jgi:hypothetical protein
MYLETFIQFDPSRLASSFNPLIHTRLQPGDVRVKVILATVFNGLQFSAEQDARGDNHFEAAALAKPLKRFCDLCDP